MNEYRAPELYLGWCHDGAVDCWSFGMVLYYMFFLRHPYGGPESEQDDRWFYDRVVGFAIPTEALRLVHPMARDLILKCLERNASMRWTMHKIKTHGYFVQVDWDQVSAKRLDVPSFGGLSLELDRTTVLPEAQKRISINPLLDNERQ
ncbi:kinase-like domain-containing protein, partial [Gymnopilus junonius]